MYYENKTAVAYVNANSNKLLIKQSCEYYRMMLKIHMLQKLAQINNL